MSFHNQHIFLSAQKVCKSFRKRHTAGLFYDFFEKTVFRESKIDELQTNPISKILSLISLEVKSGEIVGVLGRNGAGKSTLLKVFAGIVPPSSGTVNVNGPLVPVLDSGISIQWDLSGYSNLLLEGTAQGWELRELKKRLPEIIQYSGLKDHLYKPIKQFSSGMLTRLSLSTALFKDHSLFLFDEIFGAGDAQFREQNTQTILRKAKEGSAFVIVAHNTEILKKICTRAIFLDQGQITFDGDINLALDLYQKG